MRKFNIIIPRESELYPKYYKYFNIMYEYTSRRRTVFLYFGEQSFPIVPANINQRDRIKRSAFNLIKICCAYIMYI